MSVHTLNRRETIKRIALLLGGTISAPALQGLLNGARASASDVAWKPKFLSVSQAALVTEIADIIIPRTDTPGAKDIGIAAFIDSMLNEVYPPADRRRFVEGLMSFSSSRRSADGRDFMELGVPERIARVRMAHAAALEEHRRRPMRSDGKSHRPFILMLKELTLIGFFTSEAGCTQVLQHVAVPGALRACIPLSEAGNGKTWAE